MKFASETRIRFATLPVPYLCKIEQATDDHCHGYGPRKIIAVKESDKFDDLIAVQRERLFVRFRSVVFDYTSHTHHVYDFGRTIRNIIEMFERCHDWHDVLSFDMVAKLDSVCNNSLLFYPRRPNADSEADKFVVDLKLFVEDTQSGNFSFDLEPNWAPFSDHSSDDVAVDVTDGSKYVKLKSEGEHCSKCRVFYDMAEKNDKFICWACRNI